MARWNDLIDVDNMLGAIGLARSNKSSGVGSFFVGMGLGLIAGGVTALLLTPYKGEEARDRLLKAGEDLGRTVSAKYTELAGQIAGTTGTNGTTQHEYSTSYPTSTRLG